MTKISVRPAIKEDRRHLASLIQFETYVHRHLDWRPPLDWLGHEPYIVAEKSQRIVAALACPPDPPGVAWIRMFATDIRTGPTQAWELLWPLVLDELSKHPAVNVTAIPLHNWFRQLLERNGFEHAQNVVVLAWDNGSKGLPEATSKAKVRVMSEEDIAEVLEVDVAAFGPVWRNSLQSIELAYSQAALCTVAETEEGLVGYQISTPSPTGAHLARLAVHPEAQGQGIGYALVRDLLSQFQGRGKKRISVNTQQDNLVSLSLYKKAGFEATGDEFPLYQYEVT